MKKQNHYFAVFWIVLFCFSLSCSKEEQTGPIVPTVSDPRDIITGAWLCTETIEGTLDCHVYEVVIKKSPSDSSGIWMDNFALTSGNVKAILDSHQVSIPLQTVNMIKIEGSGIIHDESLSQWQYTVVFQGITEVCSAVFKPNDK